MTSDQLKDYIKYIVCVTPQDYLKVAMKQK